MFNPTYDEIVLNTVEQNNNETKKKIGRPKLTKDPPPIEVRGKSDSPALKTTIVEVIYSDPIFLKKMLSLFNAYDPTTIDIIFKPNSMEIRAKDHTSKIFIKTTFNVSKLNHYYCAKYILITVSRENLVNVLGSLSKTCNKITMTLRKDDVSYFYINHVDYETSKVSVYNLPILEYIVEEPHEIANTIKYYIAFQLTSKAFKEEIVNAKKISDKLTIIKDNRNKLWFTCDSTDNKLSYSGHFSNPKSIKMETSLKPNETRTTAVGIDLIKPVASYCVSNNVKISISDKGYIKIHIVPDGKNILQPGSVTVEVLVETIRYTNS